MPRVNEAHIFSRRYRGLTGLSVTVTVAATPGAAPSVRIVAQEGEDEWYFAPWTPTASGTYAYYWSESTPGAGDELEDTIEVEVAPAFISTTAEPSVSAPIDALLDAIRGALGDDGIHQTHIVLQGIVNGTNKRFQARYFPLGSDSVLYDGAGNQVLSGVTLSPNSGMLVFDVAPSLGAAYFLEGTIYLYPSTRLLKCLEIACQELAGVWGDTSYVVTGTGGTLAISPTPEGTDRALLVLTAAWHVLRGAQAKSAVTAMQISSASGSQDTRSRARDLAELRGQITSELLRLVAQAGYNLPRFLGQERTDEYQGQVLVHEPYGDIP